MVVCCGGLPASRALTLNTYCFLVSWSSTSLVVMTPVVPCSEKYAVSGLFSTVKTSNVQFACVRLSRNFEQGRIHHGKCPMT